MAKLQYAVNGQAFEIQVSAQGIRVGSAADAGLCIAMPSMSGYHFTIFQRGGVFSIQDLGSAAGTFVNGQRLSNHPTPLKAGSKIGAGGVMFLFLGDNQPAPVAPVAPVAPAPAQAAPQQAQAPRAPQGRPGSQRGGARQGRPSAPAPQARPSAPAQRAQSGPRAQQQQQQQQAQAPRSPRPMSGPALLHFLDSNGSAVTEYVVEEPLSIGRYEENILQFEDDLISGEHCVFSLENSVLMIEDLQSSNGTWVNNTKITGKHHLQHGDIVTLAQVARFAVGDPRAFTKAQSSGGQVLPQMKRHISATMPMVAAPSWGAPMAIAIIIFVLAAGGGFLLPQVVYPAPIAEKRETPNKAMPALSFEETSGLGGWSINARGSEVRAGIDKEAAFDGEQSLVISVAAGSKAILTSSGSLPLDFKGSGTMTMKLRGVISPNASIRVSALVEGQRRVLGSQTTLTINPRNWGTATVALSSSTPIPSAKLEIEISGPASALWMDTIAFQSEGGGGGTSLPVDPKTNDGSDLSVKLGEDRRIEVENAKSGAKVSLLPMALTAAREVIEGQWSEVSRTGDASGDWALTSGESKVGLSLTSRAKEYLSPKMKPGFHLGWLVSTGSSIATQLEFELEGETLSLYDVYGNEVPIKSTSSTGLGNVYAVGTPSIMVIFREGNMGVKVSQFKAGQSATIVATNLQHVPLETTNILLMDHSPFRVALWDGVVEDMRAQEAKGQYSAALERVKVLLGLKGEGFASYRAAATEMRDSIDRKRAALLKSMREQRANADNEDATTTSVEFALNVCDTLMHGFEAEAEVVREAKEAHRVLNSILKELHLTSSDESGLRRRKPRAPRDEAKLAEANANAKRMLAIAEKAYADGNWMQAFMFSDNLVWNLHFSESAGAGKALRSKVLGEWRNARKRRDYCLPILRRAETEIYLGGSRDKVEELLRKVIQRYPKNREADQARELLAQLAGN